MPLAASHSLCAKPQTAEREVMSTPGNVHVSRHPLLLHQLTRLRDRTTEPREFRTLVHGLTQILFYEATLDLALEPIVVQTPLAPCTGHRVVGERVGLMPILRAGLGMADAVLEVLPSARVFHLGLYRDHETRQPVT